MIELVIIGGGGAGLTAALAAKKTGSDCNVTLITKENMSYSPCAFPFLIGGDIESFDAISKSIEDICKNSGIKCLIDEAISIDAGKRIVEIGKERLPYDSLVIATGGKPFIPPIKGADSLNVHTLHRLEDAKKLMQSLNGAETAVVVGGGAIGLETAAAFIECGLKVTLVEGLEYVLYRSFDPDYCLMIEKKLAENGIELIKGKNVEEITKDDEGKVKSVKVAGRDVPADIVVMATGVRPNTKITEKAGIELVNGAIKTDEFMQTNIKGIYAAGDCTASKAMLTGKTTLSLLGTIAVRQGIVAGMNAAGESEVFGSVLNSMILRLFDMEIGRTGLTERDAKAEGMETVTGRIKSTTTAEYYPKGSGIEVKLIFGLQDKRIIGAQVVGGGGVAGIINLITFAIGKGIDVDDLIKLEYCYTPPLAPSHNPIVLAAENAYKKMKRKEEAARRRNA
ncbi:MAG: FAD-dependent oxidoreductase [Candidatus Altiarchaeota archaeon]|nr:FAD-dependent oxidoreductase [Candidatus Altiarchaeota archaeon]